MSRLSINQAFSAMQVPLPALRHLREQRFGIGAKHQLTTGLYQGALCSYQRTTLLEAA